MKAWQWLWSPRLWAVRLGPVAALLLVALLALVSFRRDIPSAAVPLDGTALARELLQDLIPIVTTEEEATTRLAAGKMADRLIAAGFPPRDVSVLGPDSRTGNLVARLRSDTPRARPLLLMAHLDVVPASREDWSVDPWTFLERDGWFYGRGTSDNKAGAAMLVANLIRLKREEWRPLRDVIVVLTGDEETSGKSIRWLLDEHRELVDAELALNTDAGGVIAKQGRPRLFTVQASEKLYADYQMEVTDPGGHSSLARPDNPIYILSEALGRVATYRFPVHVTDVARLFFERSSLVEEGQLALDMKAVASARPDVSAVERLSAMPFYNARLRTTCVATRVEAGHANNALPQFARAVVNCRILPGDSAEAVSETIGRLAGERVKVVVLEPAVESPASPLPPRFLGQVGQLVSAQWPGLPVAPTMEAGASDGLWLRRAGIPTYGISAVVEDPDDVRAHGKDERISVEAFDAAVEFWYRMTRFFGEDAVAEPPSGGAR